eukprot:1222063-Karenia_brevis.AAC.1
MMMMTSTRYQVRNLTMVQNVLLQWSFAQIQRSDHRPQDRKCNIVMDDCAMSARIVVGAHM